MAVTDIGPGVHDLAVALGVLDGSGDLRPGFFADPLGQAAGVLRDPSRRAALTDLVDQLLPVDRAAVLAADARGGETWHLLTDPSVAARVYLTLRPSAAGGLILGLAVKVASDSGSTDDGGPDVGFTLVAPLVEANDGGLDPIIGTADGAVRARLEVHGGSSAGGGDDFDVEAVTVDVALTPLSASRPVAATIAVRGLRVDGEVLPPLVVDPTQLDRDLVPVVRGLLESRLRRLAAEAGANAPAPLVALADHLLPLLGLTGDVPRLPVERLGHERAVVQKWFVQVLDAGSVWIGHLAGLLGSTATPAGAGTETDPWRVPVATLPGVGNRVELTVASRTTSAGRELLVGVAVGLAGPGNVALDAGATLATLPLTGTASPQAVPSASVLLRAPKDRSTALVDAGPGGLHVGSLRAGLRWDGAELRPVLELSTVTFEGHSYDLVDLAHVDSVRATAAAAVRAALADALGGDGPGAHLAVLLGLVAPGGEAAGAVLADPVALLTGPTRELARVHRSRLVAAAGSGHTWSAMLAQLGALLGIDTAVAGAGSAADPWRVPVVDVGPLGLDLAAWAVTAAGADPELHVALRLRGQTPAGLGSAAVTVSAELVALRFPASGPVDAAPLAHHVAHLALTGPLTLPLGEDNALTLAGVDARFDWQMGHEPEASIELTGLAAHIEGTDIAVPSLRLPPAGGFDATKPDLGLGLPVDDLDRLARTLLGRLWQDRAGDVGGLAAGLLGLLPLDELPADWPALARAAADVVSDDALLADAAPGLSELLADPLGALREWLVRALLDLSAEGAPFVPTLLDGLRRLVRPDATTPDVDFGVPGAGTWAAPWRVELGEPGASQLLLWLAPDGPPDSWGAAAAGQAAVADGPELLELMARFGASLPPLAGVFGGPEGPAQAHRLTAGLTSLLADRFDGDGVVPLLAQMPAEGGWAVAETLVDAAHHKLPEHPDAVAQVLAEVGVRAPNAAQRTVVLLGPPFADRTSWAPLLAAAEAASPGSTNAAGHFDLRSAPSPDRADLSAVTAVTSWYTADLVDAGGAVDPVVAQVAAVVGRVRELRGASGSNGKVVLVAHSTAGLAARAFTAAHPDQVAGLITLGTPHEAAPLTVLDDPGAADALRLAARLAAAAGRTGAARDAVDHLLAVVEGWQATATLPTALAYPRERFAGEADHSTGGVPALAIAGHIATDLFTQLGDDLAHALTEGPTPGAARPPSHLGIGLRAGPTTPAAPSADAGGLTVDVGLRVDATRLPLVALVDADAATLPARFAVEVRIDRPDGWLVDPSRRPGVRARRAELQVTVEVGGPPTAAAVFYDAAIDGPTAARVTLADAAGPRLLGAVVAEVAAAGAAGAPLVDALVALGLATRDGATVTVVADGLDAVQADPGGFLAARAQAALASGTPLFGLTGPPAGPWSLDSPDLPLSVELSADRLTVRLASLDVAGAVLSGELVWTGDGTAPHIAVTVAGRTAAGSRGPRLRWDTSADTLVLEPGGTLSSSSDPVTLVPYPGAEALAGRLAPLLVERMAAALAGSALLDRLGPGWELGPITELLTHPEQLLLVPGTSRLDIGRISGLLALVGELTGLTPQPPDGEDDGDPRLVLPGGLVLRAQGPVSLRTEPPLSIPGPAGAGGGGPAGSLAVELDATFTDLATLPALAGQVQLDLPLGGTWGKVGVTLGLDHGTVSLAVTPFAPGGQALAPIVLLPHFGGLGPLAAGAAALLPALLDALEARLPQPRPAVASTVLAVANAVGIHGGANPTFAAHTEQIRALAGAGGLGVLAAAQAQLPAAIGQLWTAAGLPGTMAATASGVSAHAVVAGIDFTVDAGWAGTPTVRLLVHGLRAGAVSLDPVEVRVAGGDVTGALTATVALPAEVEQLLGLRLAPSLRVDLGGSDGPIVKVRPLGPDDALVEARLLPSPGLDIGSGGLIRVLERIVLPLAAHAALDVVGQADLNAPLVGGKSAVTLLREAGIVAPGTGAPRLAVPLPAIDSAVPRVLAALAANNFKVRLAEDLELVGVSVTPPAPALPRFGLGLHGATPTLGDDVRLSVRLGEAAPTWLPDPKPALSLLLIEKDTWKLRPSLRLAPLGVRVEGPEDEALVDTDDVHLGAVTAYLWAQLDLDGGNLALSGVGGAVDLDDLGLPLGAVTAGGTSSNPVAGSLLSGGAGGGSGDDRAVTPGMSLVAAKRPGSGFQLLRNEDGQWLPFAQRPVFFGVHRSFGPLAIEQIGFGHTPAPAGNNGPGKAELLVDGGVQVGPLTVQAHELGVEVPLDKLDQPGTWQLDLAGLAVAFKTDALGLSGGLVKRAGPPVDYAGNLTIQLAGRTFTAIGAYSRPVDQQGSFTSLFVFVGLPMVLGGPPPMFITGLGGGAGYNRRLVPPANITDVPQFPLVRAIDDGVNSDPAGTLARMGTAMPPQRGSLWMAAGIRFTSFSFVKSVAVLYVSLDRGVEIGLLGVAKASIPPPDLGGGSRELASIELALKARFSTAEGVLSIQAQLTDNSWLLSRDCQLTGGFAFVVWFRREQFVLTLGGYHPSFAKPAEFPVVPRLGFHWAVSDAVAIKGESYFALTSSCVMAGGRLEVAYRKGGVYASFTAYADFLISWDPFHYDIEVGVSVTAGFRIRVCFFACVTIDVSITLGARVHLLGPPLHGEATLDLEVCSVTVAFGNNPKPKPTFLGWDAFRAKYVVGGAADGSALSVQAVSGLVPPDGAASAAARPGSQANPWRLAGNFSLQTETRLASTKYTVANVAGTKPLNDGLHAVPGAVDLAPMNVANVTGTHDVALFSATAGTPVSLAPLTVDPVVGHLPAAVWHLSDHPTAAAATVPILTGLVIAGVPTIAPDDNRAALSPHLIDFNFVPVPIGLVAAGTSPSLRAKAVARTLDQELEALVTEAGGRELTAVGAAVLGSDGAAARERVGLDPAPLGARGVRSLRARRSSPPLVQTLSASLAPPSPTPPPPVAPPAPLAPSGEATPRQVPATVASPTMVARMVAPAAVVPAPVTGMGDLASVGDAAAPVTRAAVSGDVALPTAEGEVAAGEMQVWDLPDGDAGQWVVSGPGAARVVFLDRAGKPLQDDELDAPEGEERTATAPAGAARVVVATVGQSSEPKVAGWQSGTLLAQVGRTALLAPGASVHLATPLQTRHQGQPTAQALLRAADVINSADRVTTRLPADTEVVVVVLDAAPGTDPSDLPPISIDGVAPTTSPTVVAAGHRLHLIYTVAPTDRQNRKVQVDAGEDWHLAGVLGGRGEVDDWLPAVTGAGSGVAIGTPGPTAPITVRYETEEAP
jgi:hypothetical protein